MGAVSRDPYFLFENRNGTYVDVTARSGITVTVSNTISATFADYDLDADLDLFLSHWGADQQADTQTVWRNNGNGTFASASVESGIGGALIEPVQSRGTRLMVDYSFTPNLADIDADGDPDLLMAADFGSSQVFINNADGTFTRTTNRNVIVDQAGMGAAVGDYDNDGDLDWFVSSIFESDDDALYFGNRLYENDGRGAFADVTDRAGVADGGWAWGSCFADFDNDGRLDLFHVNGWQRNAAAKNDSEDDFEVDQVRFFHAQGDGTFVEAASQAGLMDTGLGRGVACFDSDRDGDTDIVITNNDHNHLVYYRNDSTNRNHYLGVKLRSGGGNPHGVGARIEATTPEATQIREIRAGNNFASQNPPEAHFGLGGAKEADLTVFWPDGAVTYLNGVPADQLLTVIRDD